MRLADPVAAPWKAELLLGFTARNGKTILSEKRADGPLVVQKPLYPEGGEVCHAIVVHPPGGIAGGDELRLSTRISSSGHALLTTPGAGKWYRSAGPWAGQQLAFEVEGALEWLPRETIVFSGARAVLALARSPHLELVVSNTTEVGIAYDAARSRLYMADFTTSQLRVIDMAPLTEFETPTLIATIGLIMIPLKR